MTKRGVTIAIAVAVALVIARSTVFLLWEQSAFDSDQAIFGPMAKHIAEGRAFPMFIYGDRYLMAVQAWLAAPLFLVFEPSVALLKLPVVLINAGTAALLVVVLHRDAGLRPATALLASLFFAAMPPVMAKLLTETGGGNPEPFLYVLLLWVLRARPLAFGLVFAFGFVHREFTAYGVTALIAVAVLGDRRLNYERFRTVALAGIGYFVVSQVIRAAYLFSHPFGPGSVIAMPLAGADNVAGLSGRYCFAPETILPSMASLFGNFFGVVFGATNHRMVEFGVRSTLTAGVPGLSTFWPVLGLILAAALVRVGWISIRDRKPIWTGAGAVGTFLLLVGLQSGVAYAVARCGRLEPDTLRYALLMVYAGIGVVTLYFVYEPQRAWRRVMAAAVVAWTLTSAVSHALLVDEYLNRTPGGAQRVLANYLVEAGIQYARADYWTAYITTFYTGERVIVASTTSVRISSYQEQVAAQGTDAVTIQRQPCSDGGGTEAVAGNYWVCR